MNIITSQSYRKSTLNISWKDWCWSWSSNTLATWCKELTHWKRTWCWEGLGAGGEGDDRRLDGWMASPTRRTWVWVNSGSWWWTGRPGVLWFMGSQRVGHNWVTELNWTDVTMRRANHSQTWRKINPEYSLKGLLLKLKLQYFGHLMWRASSLEKALMLGKIEGKRRGERQRMRWLDSNTDPMDMNLSKLWRIMEDRGGWHAAVHGITES